jgi:hypothetical protein
MKGVTVEGNGQEGLRVEDGAVAQVQGCTMHDNKHGDYITKGTGRIENLDLAATAEPESEASGGSVGPAAGGGTSTLVTTESELRAALGCGVPRVVVKAGARIELSQPIPRIEHTVQIEGEADPAGLPTIVGAEEAKDVIRIAGKGTAVELRGLRLEGRGKWSGKTIVCNSGASLVMERCEVTGNQMYFDGDRGMGTRAELRDCTIADSKAYGLFVTYAASVLVEGGTIRGSEMGGVIVDDGSRIEVSTQ